MHPIVFRMKQQQARRMYGDLINGVIYTTILPIYICFSTTTNTDNGNTEGALLFRRQPAATTIVIVIIVWTAICSWVSYFRESRAASALAMLGGWMASVMICEGTAAWFQQQRDNDDSAECTTTSATVKLAVVPQFVWTLLVITANRLLSLQFKVCLATVSLLAAIGTVATTISSSSSSFATTTAASGAIPVLLGAFAVHVLFHYQQDVVFLNRNCTACLRSRAFSLILAGALTYHVSAEIGRMATMPSHARSGGLVSVLRVAFFVGITLASSEALLTASSSKKDAAAASREDLQIRIEEQTRMMMAQIEKLGVVSTALRAVETAMLIADSSQQIIWSNPALERLTEKSEVELRNSRLCSILPSESCRRLLEDAGCIRNNNNKASSSQCPDHELADDMEVNGTIVHAEISAFDSDPVAAGTNGNDLEGDEKENNGGNGTSATTKSDPRRFLVSLTDVTALRAHERAKKERERESIQAQAVKESMETLNHELRTPLQSILGMTTLLLEEAGSGSSTLSQVAQESLTTVLCSGRCLLTMINNLLDVRKCETQMMESFKLRPVGIRSCLQDALDFSKPYATVMGVKLDLDMHGSPGITVETCHHRFQQVMLNLVANAIKHSPANGCVYVRARTMTLADAEAIRSSSPIVGPHQTEWDKLSKAERRGKHVAVVSVVDQGDGIPEAMFPFLLGRFVAANDPIKQQQHIRHNKINSISTPERIPQGSGVGLKLCVNFVQRMKGSIWARRNMGGRGMCFSFCIPLSTPSAVPPSRSIAFSDADACAGGVAMRGGPHMAAVLCGGGGGPEMAACGGFCMPNRNHHHATTAPERRPGGGVASSGSGAAHYRVLVVDDTLINLKVLDRMLRRLGVAKVVTVDSGRDALLALKRGDFNLVLTDVQMPQMSGPQLCAEIRRALPSLKTAPKVVAITAEISQTTDAECKNAGISHVLHKPVTSTEIRHFFEAIVSTLPAVTPAPAI